MLWKVVILIFFCLICKIPVSGQCYSRDSLLKRLNILRDNSKVSYNEQINELSNYESGISACIYNQDSTHALLLRRIGTLYYSKGDYINAILYYRRSINMVSLNSRKLSVNLRDLIVSYYWLSVFYDSLNRVSEKMEALDSCASIAIRLKSIDDYCLWALYSRAVFSFDIGDYHRCINYAQLCESLAKEYAQKGSKDEFSDGRQYAISSLLWRINAMILLKNYNEAESLLEIKADEFRLMGVKDNLGVIYGLLAEVLVFKENYKKALLFHKKAFDIERESGISINCKAILNSVGHDIYFKYYKDLNKALEYYKRALKYDVKEDEYQILNSLESMSILNRIGNIFVLKGQYDSAFRYLQLAFDQIKPGINESGVLHSSLHEFIRQRRLGYIATLIIDKAEAYQQKFIATRDLNAIKEAIVVFKVADQFLEKIKAEQFDVKSKLFWRSDRRKLYERAIEACYANRNTTDAFYFFERSRAVLLYDQLQNQRWLDDRDMIRQNQLKRRVGQLEKELTKLDRSQESSLELQKEMITSKQELDHLDNKIKSKNPYYYQFFLKTDNITIQDVQKFLLKENDKLVEIFEGDSSVYIMIITKEQVYLEKIDKVSYDQMAIEFVNYISDYSLLNKNFNEFINTSYRLYQLIFQQHSMPPGRIIISPDGQYFPIEALVTDKNLPPTYLIKTHSVSYTHSARFLMINFSTGPGDITRNFMGLAPVYFEPSLKQASLIGSDISLRALRSNFLNAEIRTFADASRNNFLQDFSDYRVIQLYTHAADKKNTGEPEIYFSDSVLYLSELVNGKKPHTRLIVLSACETGTGQWYRGEGVLSFNRAFAALGIPSSISNLWAVDSKSTYQLTEIFYKYLTKGLEVDVALQKAKLEFMETGSRERQIPYYWAATILAGRTEAIEFKREIGWKYFIAGLGLVILVLFLAVFLYILKRKVIKITK